MSRRLLIDVALRGAVFGCQRKLIWNWYKQSVADRLDEMAIDIYTLTAMMLPASCQSLQHGQPVLVTRMYFDSLEQCSHGT